MKMRSVSGFTLIELVVVIGILAILAATALPRFIDTRQQAVNATAAGIAGSLASGSAVNYAGRVAGVAGGAGTGPTAVAACNDAARVLSGGALPAGASITGTTAVAAGASTSCGVNYTSGGLSAVASFDLIGST